MSTEMQTKNRSQLLYSLGKFHVQLLGTIAHTHGHVNSFLGVLCKTSVIPLAFRCTDVAQTRFSSRVQRWEKRMLIV